jgi:hypothetical protein
MLALAAAFILGGCASEVVRSGVEFRPAPATGRQSIDMGSLVTVTLGTGYQRSILTGSRWERVGSVPQGDVYRPVGTVFTIEGANTHEAFLVIRDSQIVGFYLPGERSFSPLEPATRISYKTVN